MEKKEYGEEYYYRELAVHIRRRIDAAADKIMSDERAALDEEARNLGKLAAYMARRGIFIQVEYICQIFSCTPFERICILTSYAVELEPELKEAFQNQYPTLQQCIRLYTDLFSESLQILKQCYERQKILELLFTMKERSSSASWQERSIQLNGRILDFCFGNVSDPAESERFIQIYLPGDTKEEPQFFHERERDQACSLLARGETAGIFCIRGERGIGKLFWLKSVGKKADLPVVAADMQLMSENPEEFKQQLSAVRREGVLQNGIIAFLHMGNLKERADRRCLKLAAEMLSECERAVFLLTEQDIQEERQWIRRNLLEIEFLPLTYPERLRIWRYFWEKEGLKPDILPALAERFSFTPMQMKQSIREIKEKILFDGNREVQEDVLYSVCQRQIRADMGDIAVSVRSGQTFEDLILPHRIKENLLLAVHQIQYQNQIYEEWGFAGKVLYGRGVSMLFYGPPGTGKTMAAAVMAGMLHMELYKIDLSAVMSKYIGETEKNLKKVFDAAKGTKSILFFDEADALFGKRSEVSDAQDKYANAETAYLLQKMEEYEGAVILATNYLQNFDRAFLRRIKFIIELPFPQEEERLLLWEKVFPENAPLDIDLDYVFLARQFELTGSSIKNAAVNAAFLAASQGKPISMEQIIPSVKGEIEKSGRIVNISDFGRYGYLI